MELLENKGAIYSSRPYLAMSGELMGFDQSLGLTPYNTRMKNARKLFFRELGTPNRIREFDIQLEDQGKAFVKAVQESPKEISEHIYMYAFTFILSYWFAY